VRLAYIGSDHVPELATASPCVLVVADPERTAELAGALLDPLPTTVVSKIDVATSSGGDDTIDTFTARKPPIVVLTASLEAGDSAALVRTLRGIVPRGEVGVVVIGDADGPIRTALDAIELAPDRFVPRPIAPRTLRFAVASALEAVMLVRGPIAPGPAPTPPPTPGPTPTSVPQPVQDEGSAAIAARAALRARWEALADSFVGQKDDFEDEDDSEELDESDLLPIDVNSAIHAPIIIKPRRMTEPEMVAQEEIGGTTPEDSPWKPGTTGELEPWPITPAPADIDEPLAAPVRMSEPVLPPVREPTLIIRGDEPIAGGGPPFSPPAPPVAPLPSSTPVPAEARTRTGDDNVVVTERADAGQIWSEPKSLAELIDPEQRRERSAEPAPVQRDSDLGLPMDHYADELGGEPVKRDARLEVLDDLPEAGSDLPPPPPMNVDGRDFARQLRAKMSQMAQRLFQGGAAAPAPADLAPRHDHLTEIDLSALGEDLPLGAGGVTEIENRVAARSADARELSTSPGSWDTHVRERGLPDGGEIVRGVSDAAMLLAKMFAGGATGRVAFRRDDVEKVVFFDQGRPVFAKSTSARDRMGELLVREGKITAAQYERCQTMVAESGRRMGEILVDLGYLKRRELLPAVRRHVEDILYSLFGWDRGAYTITPEKEPCAERIRLSRHPAALILEGIRRKLDRSALERMIGPASTVIEVADRERLGGIINMGDLSPEERAALAAIDGHADLAHVAATVGSDVADVLPLAWGLCVLGLATLRRADTEVPDETTALVGETDLAIDRERVRARWELVSEADYFALLGVRRDATTFEIRRAYQSARRDFSADCFPPDLRRELAQELDDIANVLDEAYRVLRDDRLRSTYLHHLVE
jgi:CheY-like chemotaxis protein